VQNYAVLEADLEHACHATVDVPLDADPALGSGGAAHGREPVWRLAATRVRRRSEPAPLVEYQARYDDMPRPVIDLGRGRSKLWMRQEVERWHAQQVARGRTRVKRSPSR
jgi:glutathione-regulated potassium-efflux system ancillary protein KefG